MKATERSLIVIAVLVIGMAVATHVARSVEFDSPGDGSGTLKQTNGPSEFQRSLQLGERGYAKVQYELGLMYHNGEGAPRQDPAEAAKWYRKAAEQGFAPAQFNLGLMYTIGQGVPNRNDAEAVKWWRKAAHQGDRTAQLSLGLMHVWGEGAPRDYGIAHVWLSRAAAQGSTVAARMLDATAEMMSSNEIARARRLARSWPGNH